MLEKCEKNSQFKLSAEEYEYYPYNEDSLLKSVSLNGKRPLSMNMMETSLFRWRIF